jgi:colanic acid/amylovoran biosynthesis glycosyltransferase
MRALDSRGLRVCVVTASYPAGAGEGFLAEEFEALRSDGLQLTVVPLWPRGALRRTAQGLETADLVVAPLFGAKVALHAALQFLRRPLRSTYWFWNLASSGRPALRLKNLAILPKALWLAGLVHAEGWRHLHAHWAATTSTCAMVAADLARVPWSMTCHRWDIYENNLLAEKGRRAAFVRFISRRGLNDARRLGIAQDQGCVIPMGVRLAEGTVVSARSGDVPLRIICVANLIPVKGHRYLVEALAILRDRRVDVHLSLAGTGALRNELQEVANRLGLSDRIEFLGQVDHADLMSRYRQHAFDLLVLPSIDMGGGEHEGVPVSLMEAMAHGIPVLSTRTGSIEELLVPELGATVEDKNADELASAIARMAIDEGFRQQAAERQLGVIQNWSSLRTAGLLKATISARLAPSKA